MRCWWGQREAITGGETSSGVGRACLVTWGRPHFPHACLQVLEKVGEAWSFAGTEGVSETVGSARSKGGARIVVGDGDSSAIGWKYEGVMAGRIPREGFHGSVYLWKEDSFLPTFFQCSPILSVGSVGVQIGTSSARFCRTW